MLQPNRFPSISFTVRLQVPRFLETFFRWSFLFFEVFRWLRRDVGWIFLFTMETLLRTTEKRQKDIEERQKNFSQESGNLAYRLRQVLCKISSSHIMSILKRAKIYCEEFSFITHPSLSLRNWTATPCGITS